MTDLILAILHHILVFGLIAMLIAQRALLNAGTVDIARLARLDRGYGMTAAAVLLVGALRVTMGGKGWAFYEGQSVLLGQGDLFRSDRPALDSTDPGGAPLEA